MDEEVRSNKDELVAPDI